jgi:hypothetical protein
MYLTFRGGCIAEREVLASYSGLGELPHERQRVRVDHLQLADLRGSITVCGNGAS